MIKVLFLYLVIDYCNEPWSATVTTNIVVANMNLYEFKRPKNYITKTYLNLNKFFLFEFKVGFTFIPLQTKTVFSRAKVFDFVINKFYILYLILYFKHS